MDEKAAQLRSRMARRAAWALAALFVAWATLPPLVMPNISHDVAEGLAWGRGWQLGYYKHPPLQAWLLEFARLAFGTSAFAYAWLSAACAVICHFAVWRAALRLVEPVTAFWASAALQAVYYHTYVIPEFNPNVLQLPAFALAGWLALKALQTGRAADWVWLGAALGAGMYAKYSVALIAVTITLFFVVDPGGRRRLATPGPWLGAATAALLVAPHALWLAGVGGDSVAYVVGRAQVDPDLGDRLLRLAEFAATTLAVSLPLILAFALAGAFRRPAPGAPAAATPDDRAARRLVLWLALGPFALTAAMALVAGFRIKAAWLAPFWCFAPLAAMLWLGIDARARGWRGAARVIAGMAALGLVAFLAVNAFRPALAGKPMRVHFPGRELAARVDALWAAETEAPLRVVIGPTQAAGSIGQYSRHRPLVRIDDVEAINAWAPEALVDEAGAVLIWRPEPGEALDSLPAWLAASRPEARFAAMLELPHHRLPEGPHARIGVAILPPQSEAPAR
jgi:4-amino-4-deoxy-L-arabinose transferase-like glycosyltransferase